MLPPPPPPAGYTGNYAGHVGATLAFMAGLFDCPAASNYKVCVVRGLGVHVRRLAQGAGMVWLCKPLL
jgi:hypothetical protein